MLGLAHSPVSVLLGRSSMLEPGHQGMANDSASPAYDRALRSTSKPAIADADAVALSQLKQVPRPGPDRCWSTW